MNKKVYVAGSREFNTPEKPISAPIFRKKFEYRHNDGEKSVWLKIYSTGFYRLFLNGKELTKGYFAPYISNPDDIVYYDEYSLANSLKNGENELFVLLGNGFANSLDGDIWKFESAAYRAAPKFSLEVTQGGAQILVSDETFEVCDSPIFFDDYRSGERYDARNEGSECEGLFTGKNLRKAFVCDSPNGEEKKCEAQPIKEFERIAPVSVKPVKDGYIYDFGVNFAGIIKLNICGKSGQKVDFTFGEVLQNGELDLTNISFGNRSRKGYVQHDVYICKDGAQKWKPCFTYHGFRYAYVQGITEKQALPDLLTYIVMHSDIPKRGTFACDNGIFNKIQECTVRSDLSNFYYFPTDCPQREKNGWTGDAALSAEQLLYNFDCEASLREWLANIRKAQNENGALPGIVPTGGWGFKWGNGPAWDGALIEITYQLYRFGGNIDVLYENSAAIAKYVDYLYTRLNENGLIGFGLGDWLESGSTYPDSYSTPVEVTDTLTSIELTQKAEQIFCVAGETKNAERAKDLCFLLTENFKKTWIKKYTVTCETQTAQAFAIMLNMFGENSAKAYGELLRIVRRDGRLKTGIIGIKRLLDCLCDYGGEEIAYRLITDAKHSGYAHNLQAGATTLWENFTLYDLSALPNSFVRKDGGGILSLNHHCWGSISAWFFNCVAGLDIVSADSVIISPVYPKRLNSAEAEFCRGERNIRVRWERKAERILLTVENCGFHGYINVGNSRIKLQFGKSEYAF